MDWQLLSAKPPSGRCWLGFPCGRLQASMGLNMITNVFLINTHHWPFVRGIHQSTMNPPHKGQWRGALMFSLICAWTNGWVNNRDAGDLRRHSAHYDATVMSRMLSITVYRSADTIYCEWCGLIVSAGSSWKLLRAWCQTGTRTCHLQNGIGQSKSEMPQCNVPMSLRLHGCIVVTLLLINMYQYSKMTLSTRNATLSYWHTHSLHQNWAQLGPRGRTWAPVCTRQLFQKFGQPCFLHVSRTWYLRACIT